MAIALFHKPTGAEWILTSYNPQSNGYSERIDCLDAPLPNGDEYRKSEVVAIAERLIAAKRA